MKRTGLLLLVPGLMLSVRPDCVAQSKHPILKKVFHIQSGGGWDYLAIDPESKNLYVSHGIQVNVLNKATGDSVGVIPGTIGVHGIAFAPGTGKGYISNGRLNNVFVFDRSTNRVLDSIHCGEGPDAIFYESFSRKIITCNGRSKDASVIDPATDKLIATIPLDGRPETAVSDGNGMMYVNLEDKNEVEIVDMRSFRVLRHFGLGTGKEPAGLAIDRQSGVLFVGCGNKKLIIVDAGGQILQTLVIGDHCDGVAFDAGSAYASNGDGTLSVVRKSPADKATYKVENIPTKRSARTIAVDPETHLIYLPAAEFESQPAGSKERPRVVPGSFQVLVFG